MTNVTGLYALGEANFSDHGANRLGASALMQGLADGYFVILYTIGDYLSTLGEALSTDSEPFRRTEAEVKELLNLAFVSIHGKRKPRLVPHASLGRIVWEYCGIARNAAGLNKALELIPALREEFWSNLRIVGGPEQLQPGARAGRPGGRLLRASSPS